MSRRRKIVLTSLAAGGLAVGLGAAGAVAAGTILSPKQENQAIIEDAASQLGVQPSALSKALTKALENRIDAAVAAGLITKEQAAEMKARIESGDAPLFGHGGMHGPGFGHGPFDHHVVFAAAAAYLGMTEADLRAQLAGSTLSDLAKKKGKSVDGLVTAMVNAAEQEIDKAVEDGKLTKDQGAALKADLKQHVERLVNAQRDDEGFGVHPRFGYRSDGPRGPPGFDAYFPPV